MENSTALISKNLLLKIILWFIMSVKLTRPFITCLSEYLMLYRTNSGQEDRQQSIGTLVSRGKQPSFGHWNWIGLRW